MPSVDAALAPVGAFVEPSRAPPAADLRVGRDLLVVPHGQVAHLGPVPDARPALELQIAGRPDVVADLGVRVQIDTCRLRQVRAGADGRARLHAQLAAPRLAFGTDPHVLADDAVLARCSRRPRFATLLDLRHVADVQAALDAAVVVDPRVSDAQRLHPTASLAAVVQILFPMLQRSPMLPCASMTTPLRIVVSLPTVACSPICELSSTTLLAPMCAPLRSFTPAPIVAYSSTVTPLPISALGWISAVGWIALADAFVVFMIRVYWRFRAACSGLVADRW